MEHSFSVIDFSFRRLELNPLRHEGVDYPRDSPYSKRISDSAKQCVTTRNQGQLGVHLNMRFSAELDTN